MQNKMQVSQLLKNFIAYVKTQFCALIKGIRTDNGTEFFQSTCGALFEQYDIVHQRSVAGTPQQSGRVERKHRHLTEMAQAVKIHANLLAKFWGSCIFGSNLHH